MCVCVCVCVCVDVVMFTCMLLRMHVRTYVQGMYVCMYVCMYICIYVCVCIYVCICYICSMSRRDLIDMYICRHQRVSADRSGKSWPHMLQMLCNTSSTLKPMLKPIFHCATTIIITMGALYGFYVLVLTFLWHLLRCIL